MSMLETPPTRLSRFCAVDSNTYTLRWLAPRLPRSTMPTILSVRLAPLAVATRNLSPSCTPMSSVNWMPTIMSLLVMRNVPATIFSGSGTMRVYCSGSMPITVIDCVASPRTTKAGPVAVGDTATTSLRCCIWSRSFCHWSTELMRCEGICTVATTACPGSGARCGVATSLGRCSVRCGCELSTRLKILACMPARSADMKTMTPTPIATPEMMNSDCRRPSRRKRRAAIHSKGMKGFICRAEEVPARLTAARARLQRAYCRSRGAPGRLP